MNDALRALTVEFIKSFPSKSQELQQAWEQAVRQKDESSLATLKKTVHELAGSTGLYGFHDIHDLCQSLQTALGQGIGSLDDENTLRQRQQLQDTLKQHALQATES